jgi:hypothetical protein
MRFVRVLPLLLLLHTPGLIARGKRVPPNDPKLTTATYRNQECGFELTRLGYWVVTVERGPHSSGPCDLTVTLSRHSPDNSTEKHSITVLTVDKDYESALRDSGFVEKDGGWAAEGRQGTLSPAEEIHGATWVGLKATTLVGCFDQSGYIGLGEAPGAVLNNKATKSALIDAGECEDADSAGLDLLLKSFEFVH